MSMFSSRASKDIPTQQNELCRALNTYYESLERFPHRFKAHKHILLIGRTRTGKTTFKQMLKDPKRIPDEPSLISTTKDFIDDTFDVSYSNLTLTVVDSEGLFNQRTRTDGPASIDDDLNRIKTFCLTKGITEFHLVCFCVSFESGINNQDLEAIVRFQEHFGPDFAQHLCMIINRCESKNTEQRARLRTELEQDAYFNDVVGQFGKGIYFSGALKRDDWNRGSDALISQFQNICDYRRQLLDMIASLTTTYKINRPASREPNSPKRLKWHHRLRKSTVFHIVPAYVKDFDPFKLVLSNCV